MKLIFTIAFLCYVSPAQAMAGSAHPFSCGMFLLHSVNLSRDTTSIRSACDHTHTALEQSSAIIQRLMLSAKRDTASIDSLMNITHTAHDSALVCKRHLTAMMLLATSEAARKLSSAENVLMFRMKIRDVQLFLAEARKYWQEER